MGVSKRSDALSGGSGMRNGGPGSPGCAALADSLGLPEAAGKVRIRREPNRISLSSSYYERVEMPLIARDILFAPQVEWTH